ncbi:hypothetical protein ACFR9U_07450 [Halorientalis brevis]|uniref:ABC transporter permease n=1 Tax=Halorientalis brevis TaxID=1126241 RepID=A0ABD6C8Z2_9EURY|nr:hypothetical protein [Halorientalis brevis]
MGADGRVSRGAIVRTLVSLLAVAAYVGTGYVTYRAYSILQDAPPLTTDPLELLNLPTEAIVGPAFLVAAVLAGHFASGLLCLAVSVGGRTSLPLVPRPSFSAAERSNLRFAGGVFAGISLLAGGFAAAPLVVSLELAGLLGVVGVVVLLVLYVLGAGYVVSVLVPPLSSMGVFAAALSALPGVLVVDFAVRWLLTAPVLQTTAVALVVDLVVLVVALVALSATQPAIREATREWIVFLVAVYLVVASWSLAGVFAPALPTLFAILAVVALVPLLVAVRGYAG